MTEKEKRKSGANESPEQRRLRLADLQARASTSRQAETDEEKARRLAADQVRAASTRQAETDEEKAHRLAAAQVRPTSTRQALRWQRFFDIGRMDRACDKCDALKWDSESPGLCCNNGKVSIPLLPHPPHPLDALLDGSHTLSVEFLRHIRKYNCALQMTSIGMRESPISDGAWIPSIRIQGVVYHRIGSLFPAEGQQPLFCQMFFLDPAVEIAAREQNMPGLNIEVLKTMQTLLHEHNAYVRSLKSATDVIQNLPNAAECYIVIDVNKRPTGEHARRFNLPETPEVAVIMDSEPFGTRDIALRARDGGLQRISETPHRSYDPLQYILFSPL